MGRKIGEGKSKKVTVSENTTIVQGNFYLLDGFFGMAVQSMTTDADGKVISYNGLTVPAGTVSAEVVLNIEEMEVETSQINTGDAFAVGAKVYYDSTAGLLTTTAGSNRFVGVVTQAKDANNVIWFMFMPNSAEVASALGTSKGFATFVVPGTLVQGAGAVAGFKFNKAVTVTKVKARVGILPGATAALAIDVNNGAASLFTASQEIASTDTAGTFKEFTPDADPAKNAFLATDVLSIDVDNPGNTAAADLEVVVEFDQTV